MVLRIARQVFEEYQGQLWRGAPGDALDRQSLELSQACTNLYYTEYDKQMREKELQKMEKALLAARVMKPPEGTGDTLGAGEVVAYLQDKVEQLRVEVESLKKEEIAATGALPTLALRHDALTTCMGMMALWAVDLRWGHVAPDGSLRLTNRQNLPKDQLAQAEQYLDSLGVHVRVLVLALEYPLVDVDISQSSKFWAPNDDDQASLLQVAIKWKAKAKDREVLILAGGLCVGMESVIKRRESNKAPSDGVMVYDMEFQQMVTGPVADQLGDAADLWEKGTIGKHPGKVFDFAHSFPVADRHYLEVVLRVEDDLQISIHRQYVRPYLKAVTAVLGPIIGEVTCKTAVVLLEVDVEAPVTCVASDTLSGRQHKVTRRMVAGRPCSFVFNTLEANHNYEVREQSIVLPIMTSQNEISTYVPMPIFPLLGLLCLITYI